MGVDSIMKQEVFSIVCLCLVTQGRGLSLGVRDNDRQDVGEVRSPRVIGFLSSLFHHEPVSHGGHVSYDAHHYDPHHPDPHHIDPHHHHHHGKRSAAAEAIPGYGGYGHGYGGHGYGHGHHHYGHHHHHHHCDYYGHG